MMIWLVVWNIWIIFPYIGNNHPYWLHNIFQRGWNHQPVIADDCWKKAANGLCSPKIFHGTLINFRRVFCIWVAHIERLQWWCIKLKSESVSQKQRIILNLFEILMLILPWICQTDKIPTQVKVATSNYSVHCCDIACACADTEWHDGCWVLCGRKRHRLAFQAHA